jgi:hypothetical protein
MLVYGSLTGEGISVGDDPRLTLSGRRILEVYWLGYWLPRLDKSGFFAADRPALPQLIDECLELIRQGILNTSPGKKFSLDDIHYAVTESESVGGSGKVLIAPTPKTADVRRTLWTPAGHWRRPQRRRSPLSSPIGQQGRNGIQAGGGGGGGPHIGGGGGGPHIGGGGGPQAAGPGGGGGGPQGAASAMPAPMPVAAIVIPPHNAVAPSSRRSLTVRNPISISLRWRNIIEARQGTLP